MTLGMSLATFTLVHVLISLAGIGSGLVVLFGMLTGRRMDGWLVSLGQVQAEAVVMFVVGVGSLLTTALLVRDIAHHAAGHAPVWFSAPKSRKPSTSWIPKTMPMNSPVSPTMNSDCTPTNSIASRNRLKR